MNESLNDTMLFQTAIQRILPHRYPFLLVDRVIEFEPGQCIVGIKRFSADDAACQGGPCEASLVPLGIVLEAVTQLGAILVLERPQIAGKVAVILQIPAAQMLEPIQPGDELRLEARVVKLGEVFGELRGLVYREGKLVAEGQMRFAVADASELRNDER